MTFPKLLRIPSIQSDEPDCLLYAARNACGIRGGLLAEFKISASRAHERIAIGRPGDFADVLAIVGGIPGDRV